MNLAVLFACMLCACVGLATGLSMMGSAITDDRVTVIRWALGCVAVVWICALLAAAVIR